MLSSTKPTEKTDNMEYAIDSLGRCTNKTQNIIIENTVDASAMLDAEIRNNKEADAYGEAKKSERKRTAQSAEAAIKAEFDDGSETEFIIVSDEHDANGAERIFYLSESGRELLSAAYARQRRRRGSLDGRNYKVLSVRYPLWKDNRISELVFRNELRIRPNGGRIYKYSKRHTNDDVIEALLYSLATNRYEVIRATRDRAGLSSFVDVSLYREFAYKYGRPALTPTFDDNRETVCKSAVLTSLNAKSVLKAYGYSVTKSRSVEDEARQELLAEIVDLGILQKEVVVGFLDFLIASHFTSKDTDARTKWHRDRQFIQNYWPDPQRFLRARD